MGKFFFDNCYWFFPVIFFTLITVPVYFSFNILTLIAASIIFILIYFSQLLFLQFFSLKKYILSKKNIKNLSKMVFKETKNYIVGPKLTKNWPKMSKNDIFWAKYIK